MSDDPIRDVAARKAALVREFDAGEDTIIAGVVGANGPAGGTSYPSEIWSLHLSLVAWKEVGGDINRSRLIVSGDMTRDMLKELQSRIRAESLIQFRARLSLDSPFGDARARMIELLRESNDEQLHGALADYCRDVTVKHPRFGEMVLNRSVDWFEGSPEWQGKAVRIAVTHDENGSLDASFETAEKLFEDSSGWSRKIEECALSRLLDLKNDAWLENGQTSVSGEEFLQHMELESITVYADGSFEFWYNDGDLFWGHAILVTGSVKEGPTDADICG